MTNVVTLFTPYKTIATAVRTRCSALELSNAEMYLCISEAIVCHKQGRSIAWSISQGVKKAMEQGGRREH